MHLLFNWKRSTLIIAGLLLMLSRAGDLAHAGQNPVEVDSAKLWVGKNAKPFILPGVDGKPVDIGKELGRRPIVLVFYRGVW